MQIAWSDTPFISIEYSVTYSNVKKFDQQRWKSIPFISLRRTRLRKLHSRAQKRQNATAKHRHGEILS